MFIEKLASLAQEPQRSFTRQEIFVAGVSKCKPSLTATNKQQIQMFFEAGQRPAYRRSRELEIGGRSAERSCLRSGNEYADVIEIGRFAHAQRCGAAMIYAGGEIWNRGVPYVMRVKTISHAIKSRSERSKKLSAQHEPAK